MTTEAATAPALVGVELGRPGRQVGYAPVSHSDNVYDASVIPVPVASIGTGEGPTALIVAGTHGDEYEGQLLVRELIHALRPEEMTGTALLVPSCNAPAVAAGTRVSPIDAGNLNRSYPGTPDGAPTDQVADVVVRTLLPRADVVIDLHSGGSNSVYVPSMFLYRGPDEAMWARKVAAAEAFGLPYAIAVPARLEPGSLSTAGDDAGALTLSTELAGGGTVDRRVLATARAGLVRLLAEVGVLTRGTHDSAPAASAARPPAAGPTAWLSLGPDSASTSTVRGLFEPLVGLGDTVRAGQPVARVYPLDEIDRAPLTYSAHCDGTVAIIRRPTLVHAGSHLVNIATPLDHPF